MTAQELAVVLDAATYLELRAATTARCPKLSSALAEKAALIRRLVAEHTLGLLYTQHTGTPLGSSPVSIP